MRHRGPSAPDRASERNRSWRGCSKKCVVGSSQTRHHLGSRGAGQQEVDRHLRSPLGDLAWRRFQTRTPHEVGDGLVPPREGAGTGRIRSHGRHGHLLDRPARPESAAGHPVPREDQREHDEEPPRSTARPRGWCAPSGIHGLTRDTARAAGRADSRFRRPGAADRCTDSTETSMVGVPHGVLQSGHGPLPTGAPERWAVRPPVPGAGCADRWIGPRHGVVTPNRSA
jgi:hypothetical protein